MYTYLAKASPGAVEKYGEYWVTKSHTIPLPMTKMYRSEWVMEISHRGKRYIKNRYACQEVEFSDEDIMMMTLKARPW